MNNLSLNIIKKAFKNKDSVTLYIPILHEEDLYQQFIVEVLDLVEAYLDPLTDGLNKNDILDYLIKPEFSNVSLFDYLHFKRFIANKEDFLDLFLSYCNRYCSKEGLYYEGFELNVNDELSFDLEKREIYIADFIKGIPNLLNGIEQLPENIRKIFVPIGTPKILYFKLT